ncbi:MAG: restriction endonuclease subunit S, partial [Chromatocurvus sp.]
QKDYGPGLPIINVKQLYRGRYADTRELLELSSSAISNPEALFVVRGDILFARSSVKASGAGQVAMVGTCPKNTVFSGFIIRFRITETERALPEYLNYLLRSPVYRELLTRIGTGTTITNLSQGALRSLTVRLPKLAEQHKVVTLLSALDVKIELNRLMNETLEAMVRAIFRDWFVAFGPTRAKMEGGEPYLAPDLWALFPARLDDNGKPEGWRREPVIDQAEWVNGAAYKNMHFSDEPDAFRS